MKNKISITESDISDMIMESVSIILERSSSNKRRNKRALKKAQQKRNTTKPIKNLQANQQGNQNSPANQGNSAPTPPVQTPPAPAQTGNQAPPANQGNTGNNPGVGGLLNGVRNFVRKTYNTTMGNYNSQFTNPKYMNNRNGMVQADSNGQSQMSYKEANEWLEKSGMKATDVMNALNNPGGNSAFDNLQTQDPILAQKVIALCKMLTK